MLSHGIVQNSLQYRKYLTTTTARPLTLTSLTITKIALSKFNISHHLHFSTATLKLQSGSCSHLKLSTRKKETESRVHCPLLLAC